MKQDSKDDTRALVDATRETIKATREIVKAKLDLEQGAVNDPAALNRMTLAIERALRALNMMKTAHDDHKQRVVNDPATLDELQELNRTLDRALRELDGQAARDREQMP